MTNHWMDARSPLGRALVLLAVAVGGCANDDDNPWSGYTTAAEAGGSDELGDGGDDDGGDEAQEEGSSEGGVKLDTLEDETETSGGPVGDPCQLIDELDGYGSKETAPADSFEPVLQWAWEGEDGFVDVQVNPVVANLTDDDQDGDIDLCDTPDVVVVAYDGSANARLYVFDGETGSIHFMVESSPQTPFGKSSDLALGDIDGDGIVEIIVGSSLALEHDGTPKWTREAGSGRPALADIDNDGDVEIIDGTQVIDHLGNTVWADPSAISLYTVAADLDGDEDQELIFFGEARHHDGSPYFASSEPEFSDSYYGFPQVADVDDDGLPEVVYTSDYGLTILEHDGQTKVSALRPTGEEVSVYNWNRPATIHDYDGDFSAEIGLKTGLSYTVVEPTGAVIYATPVNEWNNTGSGGTAFDFLGDGTAEGIYADNYRLWGFDEGGEVVFEATRQSFTAQEYPIVVDLDNDGSSEIVVTSTPGNYDFSPDSSPTVQVFRDAEDRWVPSRRIWNQHTYHVTNVREDGTIPQVEIPHWTTNNTFRTQNQITVGTTPKPVP